MCESIISQWSPRTVQVGSQTALASAGRVVDEVEGVCVCV